MTARKVAKPRVKAKPKPKAKRSSKQTPPSMSSRVSKDQREYEAQDDLRTLKRADEIRRDHARIVAVERQLKKEQEAINSLRRGIERKKR